MEKNILNQDINELHNLKSMLVEYEELKSSYEVQEKKEDELEELYINRSREVEAEITNIVKQRQQELTSRYDEEINQLKSKIKKIQSKRKKIRTNQMEDRIKSEKKELISEKEKVMAEINELYVKEQIPEYCEKGIYFYCFDPLKKNNYLVIAVLYLIATVATTQIIQRLLFGNGQVIYTIMVEIVLFLITIIVCSVIRNSTVKKKPEVIRQAHELYLSTKSIDKQLKKIRSNVTKDKDDSLYSLDLYNQDLVDYEEQLNSMVKEKNEAITTFLTERKQVIENEIRSRSNEEIVQLKEEFEALHDDNRKVQQKITKLSTTLVNEYEVYLGKEVMNVEVITTLINIMQNNQLTEVGEAVTIYKSIDC